MCLRERNRHRDIWDLGQRIKSPAGKTGLECWLLQDAILGLVEAAMNGEASAVPPVAHRVFVMAESAPLKATASPVHRRCIACLGRLRPWLSFDRGSRRTAQREHGRKKSRSKA
jgi:hypothetical protein